MLRHEAALLVLVVLAFVGSVVGDRSQDFADDLEKCIRDHAAEAVRTLPTWADVCLPPTEKIDKQAAIYERTLATIYEKWGYPGALWVSKKRPGPWHQKSLLCSRNALNSMSR